MTKIPATLTVMLLLSSCNRLPDAEAAGSGLENRAIPVQCGKDTDCKGDRICDEGTCITPQTGDAPAFSVDAKPPPVVRSPVAASPYKPFIAPNGKVTMGNCHMGSCSWARWISVKPSRSRPNEQVLLLKLLGGSSDHEDDYPDSPDGVSISWNAEPHTVEVVCSHTKPTVIIDKQVDILPLSVAASIPDVLYSSVSMYFEACHSDFASRPIEDTIRAYGYNVRLPEYEN